METITLTFTEKQLSIINAAMDAYVDMLSDEYDKLPLTFHNLERKKKMAYYKAFVISTWEKLLSRK